MYVSGLQRSWGLTLSSFKDAVATIRRSGVEFQYQLVVTLAYEEGEEQLLDDDAECKSQKCQRPF